MTGGRTSALEYSEAETGQTWGWLDALTLNLKDTQEIRNGYPKQCRHRYAQSQIGKDDERARPPLPEHHGGKFYKHKHLNAMLVEINAF